MTGRLLVLEYITGGGLASEDLPPSLAREGDMMLQALLRDLAAIPSFTVTSTRDARLTAPGLAARFRTVGPSEDVWALWRRMAEEADAVWPIAPETGGILERLSHLVLEAGCRLIGSAPQAVALAASKRGTSRLLAEHGIRAVPTYAPGETLPSSDSGWVVKPDDGAGAEDTRFFSRAAEVSGWIAAQAQPERYVAQPFLSGEAASLCALFRDGAACVLACNRQNVVHDGNKFRYRGFEVGAMEPARSDFEKIAVAVASALPGLFGYAGIDFIMTADGPVVLEINPRLTTTYAGLSTALGCNAAELVLNLAAGEPVPRLRPRCSVTVDMEHAHV